MRGTEGSSPLSQALLYALSYTPCLTATQALPDSVSLAATSAVSDAATHAASEALSITVSLAASDTATLGALSHVRHRKP